MMEYDNKASSIGLVSIYCSGEHKTYCNSNNVHLDFSNLVSSSRLSTISQTKKHSKSNLNAPSTLCYIDILQQKNNEKWIKLPTMLMMLSGLLLSLTTVGVSNAALSAQTANTIEGTLPYLVLPDGVTTLTNLDQLAGFSMWDGTYESDGVTKHMIQVNATMAGRVITTPEGFSFNDVHALVSSTGSSESVASVTVGDDDGDADGGAGTVLGTIKVEWKDNGMPIPLGSQGLALSGCGGPYTLSITVDGSVSANTMYGAPRTNVYGTNPTVTYTFVPSGQKICYIQPASMKVYTVGLLKYAGGYNPAVWESGKGFSTLLMSAAGVTFPTTGFEKAEFSLIGSGSDQSGYRCTSVDDGGKISLSGTASTTLGGNCTVTYNSATRAAFTAGGTPRIDMQYDMGGGSWVTVDSYQIPAPTLWAIGAGLKSYGNTKNLATSTSFPALDTCRVVVDGSASPATTQAQVLDMTEAGKAWRQKYLYRRDELTNGTYVDRSVYPELSVPDITITNSFSRDVDGTFMGEWGLGLSYAGSSWTVGGYYLTAELWSASYPFRVHSSGAVGNIFPNSIFSVAVCRGE